MVSLISSDEEELPETTPSKSVQSSSTSVQSKMTGFFKTAKRDEGEQFQSTSGQSKPPEISVKRDDDRRRRTKNMVHFVRSMQAMHCK